MIIFIRSCIVLFAVSGLIAVSAFSVMSMHLTGASWLSRAHDLTLRVRFFVPYLLIKIPV